MKQVKRDTAVLERMAMTFELYEVAEAMKRQNLLRNDPSLGEAELEKRILNWLYDRPGVEHGDVDGTSFILRGRRD